MQVLAGWSKMREKLPYFSSWNSYFGPDVSALGHFGERGAYETLKEKIDPGYFFC